MFARRFLVHATIAALLCPSAANALTFSTEPVDATKSVILVAGVFEPTESLTSFVSLAKGLGTRSGIVVFNSVGGNPSKAIELGRLIRALGLQTFQMRGMECSSACALAFMGGTVRVAETGSIGVHKTSFSDTSAISVDDAVSYIQHQTAETISYMTEMGVDPSLLQLSLRYEKDDMRYLSKSEMAQYRVTNLGDAPAPSQPEISANNQPSAPETKAMPSFRIAGDDPRFQIPLAKTGKTKIRGLDQDQIARMQQEAASLERDFKTIEQDYGTDNLELVLTIGYIRELLGNARVVRYLAQFHPGILSEFQKVTELRKAA